VTRRKSVEGAHGAAKMGERENGVAGIPLSPALLHINSAHANVQKLACRRSQRGGADRRHSGRGRVSQTCDNTVEDVIILILYNIIIVKLAPAHDICTFIGIGLPLPVRVRVFVCGCECLRLSGCVYERGGRGMFVCVRVRKRNIVYLLLRPYLCVHERERGLCMCHCLCMRVCVCVYSCGRESERGRECVCRCMYICFFV
jgi:hypothetical protein